MMAAETMELTAGQVATILTTLLWASSMLDHQLFANGQRTDDIDNYARSVHFYSLLKPREWWINQL